VSLFPPTCFDNVMLNHVEVLVLATRVMKSTFFVAVNMYGTLGFLNFMEPGMLHSHKCGVAPTSSMSCLSAKVSFSPFRYFKAFAERLRLICMMSNVMEMNKLCKIMNS
jgi:hypothetical protein